MDSFLLARSLPAAGGIFSSSETNMHELPRLAKSAGGENRNS